MSSIAEAIAREKKLVYWRNYYDQHRERILARQMERYQETREARKARKAARLAERLAALQATSPEETLQGTSPEETLQDTSPAPKKKRGPKPKPRRLVITVGPKGEVCVGGCGL